MWPSYEVSSFSVLEKGTPILILVAGPYSYMQKWKENFMKLCRFPVAQTVFKCIYILERLAYWKRFSIICMWGFFCVHTIYSIYISIWYSPQCWVAQLTVRNDIGRADCLWQRQTTWLLMLYKSLVKQCCDTCSMCRVVKQEFLKTLSSPQRWQE